MKKKIILMSSLLIAMTAFIFVSSCSKDEKTAFTVSSIMAGSIDLNGATAPTNVPPDPTITATFSVGVDAASVNNNSITLIRSYDAKQITLTLTVAGSVITIVPDENLGNGTLYTLGFTSAIMSTDGQGLSAFTRTFTTEGTFVPNGMVAYWSFENTAAEVLGNFDLVPGGVIDIAYASSYSAAAGQAAKFNGATTLIETAKGDSLMLTKDFTLAFWVMADSTKHGQFVMGLAGWYGFQFEITGDYSWCKLAAQYTTGETTTSQDLWFPGDGITKDNGGWKGFTFCKDLTGSGGVKYLLANKWAHVVCRFISDTKIATMYINGEKMKEQDYNLYDAPMTLADGLKYNGNPGNNNFVFGFIQDKNDPTIADDWAKYENPANGHFKGLLDNVRVYHKALTEQEIQLMYDSEKP
jgi:hypothetical protein